MDDKELLMKLTGVIEKNVAPVVERMTAFDARFTAMETRLTVAETARPAGDGAVLRVDAQGRPVDVAAIAGTAGGTAPAHLRNRTKDSAPLLVMNVVRAIKERDWIHAKEEKNISDKIRALGYTTESQGGVFYPLDVDFIPSEIAERDAHLITEIKQRMSLATPDPSELMWWLRRYPQMAQGFGLTQRDLSTVDETLGAVLIAAIQGDRVIDFLRARSVLVRAGAQELPLPPAGNISWPRLTADPSFVYADPDSSTDQATSNLGTGVVRLQAKSLRGYITIPNDLSRYSNPAVELLARSALGSKAAIAEDQQMLEGIGSTLAPKGIINYDKSAAETVQEGKITLHVAGTVGANGDTLTPEDIATIGALYDESNDPDPATAWCMRPRVWSHLRNKRAGSGFAADDGKGPFMFPVSRGDMGNAPRKELDGVAVYTSTQVSNNRAKGAALDLDYLLFGNFRRLLIGRSGAVEITASEHVKFLQDKTVIKCILRSDAGLEHEQSFVFTDTIEIG